MYTPTHYRLEDASKVPELIARWPFATLVAVVDGEPVATHIPMLLEGGLLVGHVARPNPVWRAIADGGTALAIFHGPHAYVSPSWYTEPRGEVPTWNYAAIHVTGGGTVFEDRERLRGLVDRLTALFDPTGFRADWSLRRVEGLLGGIVGVEMRMDKVEAKAKLNQNKTPADRVGVLAALDGTDVAALMREILSE